MHLVGTSVLEFLFICSVFYSNIYIQQDATLHSLFYLETALHVSVGTSIHHQERKQLYLQRLVLVTPIWLRPVTTCVCKPETANTVRAPDYELETCWAFNEQWDNKFHYKVISCRLFLLKINCVTFHLVGYIYANIITLHGPLNVKYHDGFSLRLKNDFLCRY